MANSVFVDHRLTTAGLAAAMFWMAPAQGRTLDLSCGQLQVGLVMTARRAVTCTVRLCGVDGAGLLAGGLSAIAIAGDGCRLVFKGLALAPGVSALAPVMLGEIAGRVDGRAAEGEVAA